CGVHRALHSFPTRRSSDLGGSADIYTRQVAEKLREKFGQPFVVVNKTGAAGVVGTAQVARSTPDGYTLLTTGNAQLISEPLRKRSEEHTSELQSRENLVCR